MSYVKKKVAMFLCALLAFTMAFGVVPTQEVKANTVIGFQLKGLSRTENNHVEKGATNLNIGNYLYAYTYIPNYKNLGVVSDLKGVTYKSSKTSVAAVSSTGKITAKKTGTTNISITYKGYSISIKLKVVSSLKSIRSQHFDYKEMNTAAESMIKTYGKGLTKSNRYAVLSAYKLWNKRFGSYATGTSNWDAKKNQSYYSIYCPAAGKVLAISNAFEAYAEGYNPFIDESKSEISIKGISGTGKSIKITMKKAATADQIFGAQCAASRDTYVTSKKKITFPVYVRDTKTGHKYYAIATMSQGIKTITVKTENLKLAKGRTYTMVADTTYSYNSNHYDASWLDGTKSSFKAK